MWSRTSPHAVPANEAVRRSAARQRLAISLFAAASALTLVACGRDSALSAQRGQPSPPPVRALVMRADSLERDRQWAAAAAAWHQAAMRAPAVQHWLLLRAAAAHPEQSVRARWLREVTLPPTADTVAWRRRREGAELRALLRYGDTTAAVQRYLQLGNVRDSVVALSLRVRRGDALTVPEHLALARGARRIGDAPLARREYAVLQREAATTLTGADRYAYGMLLFGAARYADAMKVFAGVRGDEAGLAAYQRARSLLRLGRGANATAALRAVSKTFPRDTTAAGLALYLLGDLASDAGRDDEAARTWQTFAERYPSHQYAARARFRAAMVHVAAARWRQVTDLLGPLAARPNPERQAARYWQGRAQHALGAAARADSLWRAIVAEGPDSYYALLASRRLGGVPWRAAEERAAERAAEREPDHTPPAADGRLGERVIADAVQRAVWLDSLGLVDEARDERNDLVKAAAPRLADARAAAEALLRAQQASPAIQLALRTPALTRSRFADDQRLRYPLPYASSLSRYARAERLPLPFVAALIRQESRFTPTARSGADARGLMQVMPSVGRSLAKSMGMPRWHDSLLYDPDVNLRLGSRHLAAALRREAAAPSPNAARAYALAAYNAGRSRMIRWRAKRGAAQDWELFVERIPYDETRDYVRIVLRNEAWYRALYPTLAQDE